MNETPEHLIKAAREALIHYYHDGLPGGWPGHGVTGKDCSACRDAAREAAGAVWRQIVREMRMAPALNAEIAFGANPKPS